MRSKYFSEKELACPHCADGDMDRYLLSMLDMLRERVGRPLILNSAKRCIDHNKAIGGEENSAHLIGRAADIRAATGKERFQIVNVALIVGFRRIGVGKSFVHVDNATVETNHPQDVIWIY